MPQEQRRGGLSRKRNDERSDDGKASTNMETFEHEQQVVWWRQAPGWPALSCRAQELIDRCLGRPLEPPLHRRKRAVLIVAALRSLGREGLVGEMRWLIRAVHEWNERDSPDLSALLMEACCKGDLLVVRQLHRAGADFGAVSAGGSTPLHAAMVFKNRELLSCLLWEGVNVNQANRRGETPLTIALKRGDVQSVETLYHHYPAFCRSCAETAIHQFRGWPGPGPRPAIPLLVDGTCAECGGETGLVPELIAWIPRFIGLGVIPSEFGLMIMATREESLAYARQHRVGVPYRPLYGRSRIPFVHLPEHARREGERERERQQTEPTLFEEAERQQRQAAAAEAEEQEKERLNQIVKERKRRHRESRHRGRFRRWIAAQPLRDAVTRMATDTRHAVTAYPIDPDQLDYSLLQSLETDTLRSLLRRVDHRWELWWKRLADRIRQVLDG